MANTTNIDLVKPLGTDHALISVINSNYDKIDTEAGKVRSNMALVQNTNTATEAIAKDQLVLWKGVLKKATSAIASGATLSASNLANTDIANELAALNNHIANIDTSLEVQLKMDIDANTLTQTGKYYLRSGCTNVPTAYLYLDVFADPNSSDIIQVGYPVTEDTIYRRRLRRNGNSDSWKSVSFS